MRERNYIHTHVHKNEEKVLKEEANLSLFDFVHIVVLLLYLFELSSYYFANDCVFHVCVCVLLYCSVREYIYMSFSFLSFIFTLFSDSDCAHREHTCMFVSK